MTISLNKIKTAIIVMLLVLVPVCTVLAQFLTLEPANAQSCYQGSGSNVRSVACEQARGNSQSSVSYRNADGQSIPAPLAGNCYLSPGTDPNHNTYQQQPGDQCATLEEAAASNVDTNEPEYDPNDCNSEDINQENCGIVRYLVIFINVLSALAGIAIIGSIVFGGIQYSMAGSDPQKVSAAKDRIRNALIALLFFLFGVGLLNYLVPGGIL